MPTFGPPVCAHLGEGGTREWLVPDGRGGYAVGTVSAEWALGSITETADGQPPHAATGCPFQAWSVAEVLRAHRLTGGG